MPNDPDATIVPEETPTSPETPAAISGGTARSLVVQPIPVRTRLVDTIGPLTVATLRAYKDEGAEGIIGYLGGNLTAEAIESALGYGMGIVPVNYSRREGWLPSAELGAADATNSVRRLSLLGVPLKGLDDWCDIEGCGGDPTAYCEAWCGIVAGDGAGRVPKEYVGAGALLSGHAHYLLPFKGYWHSCSRAIPEPDCGFQMFQLYPPDQPVAGASTVDWDFVARDFLGRAPTWLKAQA